MCKSIEIQGGLHRMTFNPLFVMALGLKTWTIVAIVITVILIAGIVALYIYAKKLQDRQESNQKEMEAAAQNMSLLIIDKKRMKLKEAKLPAIAVNQVPKHMRSLKLPIVKAKVGPRIMTFTCDEKVFEQLPLKKEVRARVSGIHIVSVKGLRTNLEAKPKKKKFSDKLPWKKNKE